MPWFHRWLYGLYEEHLHIEVKKFSLAREVLGIIVWLLSNYIDVRGKWDDEGRGLNSIENNPNQ